MSLVLIALCWVALLWACALVLVIGAATVLSTSAGRWPIGTTDDAGPM